MKPSEKGYTIPLIDWANDSHRQVVVDREQGQYLGHPTTVLLEDGRTMIAVYPKVHGRGAIVMKRSTDGGLTWSNRLPVPDNWATSLEVPTIYRTIDPHNVKRLITFSGLSPVRMAVSEDDGETWTPLEPIGEYGGVVAMADMVRPKDGRYMAVFHDDGRFMDHDGRGETSGQSTVYKILSSDGGLTWSEPQFVTKHTEAYLCEPGIVRSPDGNQLAVLLRENKRRFNSMIIFSNDDGESWTDPVELPTALTGDRHQACYGPDGRLFISFRDTAHITSTYGDWVGWVGTYDDLVQGNEGQYRLRLMINHANENGHLCDCAYPAIELLPDGTFVTTTYGHWIEGDKPFVMSVRFSLGEVDSLATAP